MKRYHLEAFIKGWFIGNFQPSILPIDCEVGIKRYEKGDYEPLHHHKIATEITVIISGEIEMNEVKYETNDIIVIEPNEATDFRCLTDVITCVFKSKSVSNDKYLGES